MNPRHCALRDLGCIAIRGDDARDFLHAQLSRDVAALDEQTAPLAGWHDARGRVRALFRVLRVADGWLLLTPRDTIEPVLGRLRMYVLRARVTLAPAPEWHVAALVGGDGAWLAAQGPVHDLPRDGVVVKDSLRFVRLGPEHVVVVGAGETIEGLARQLPAGTQDLAWLGEIRLGLPAITATPRRTVRRPDAESRSFECDLVRQGLLSRTGSHRARAQLGLGQAAHAPLRDRVGEPPGTRFGGARSRR